MVERERYLAEETSIPPNVRMRPLCFHTYVILVVSQSLNRHHHRSKSPGFSSPHSGQRTAILSPVLTPPTRAPCAVWSQALIFFFLFQTLSPAAFWSLAYILSDKRAKQEITEEVFSLFNKKDTGREVHSTFLHFMALWSSRALTVRVRFAFVLSFFALWR